MSDGQSEACRDQLCYKHGDRILANPELISYLAGKVRHGCPGMTIDDQRIAVYLLTGNYEQQKVRCKKCNGEGEIVLAEFNRKTEPCGDCAGQGYTKGEHIGITRKH